MMANWKENKMRSGGEIITIQPGQFWTCQDNLADRCGYGRQTIRTALKKLSNKNIDFLTSEPTNHGTLITIKNWDTYQPDEPDNNQQTNQQVTSDQPAANQRLTRTKELIKNDKKLKKGKKKDNTSALTYDSATRKLINIPDEFINQWKATYPNISIDAELMKMESWLTANPKKRYENYKRFINGWLNRENEKRKTEGDTRGGDDHDKWDK
jgi:DNA replication protein DnaD